MPYPRDAVVKQPCYQELTIKWGCQISEEVVSIKCGVRKEVCTMHDDSKI